MPTLSHSLMLKQDILPHPRRSIATWQKYTVQFRQYFPGDRELATCTAEFDMPLTTAGETVRPRLATAEHSNLHVWAPTFVHPSGHPAVTQLSEPNR